MGVTERAGDIHFFMEKKENSSIGNMIIVHHRILSTFKTAEFFSGRVSYM